MRSLKYSNTDKIWPDDGQHFIHYKTTNIRSGPLYSETKSKFSHRYCCQYHLINNRKIEKALDTI